MVCSPRDIDGTVERLPGVAGAPAVGHCDAPGLPHQGQPVRHLAGRDRFGLRMRIRTHDGDVEAYRRKLGIYDGRRMEASEPVAFSLFLAEPRR